MDALSTINLIDAGIGIAGQILGFIGQHAHKSGATKLGLELQRMASDVNAFRTSPVYAAEIEAMKLNHTWSNEAHPPLPPAPPEEGKVG